MTISVAPVGCLAICEALEALEQFTRVAERLGATETDTGAG